MTNPRAVVVVSYDSGWPQRFAELSRVISVALGQLALAIEHVGGTSVPGLAAKPIIDLDVVIGAKDDLPETIRCLATLGYVHAGDLDVPGREAFKRTDVRTPWDGSGHLWMEHHLYVCARDSAELARHLTFRNYLRSHPEIVRAYADIKRGLARRFGKDREAYTEGKGAFVEEVLRKARE